MIERITENIRNSFNYKECNFKIASIIIAVSFLFFFPVIYGSGYYEDDVFRVNLSNAGFGWDQWGRFLLTDVAQLFSNNRTLNIDSSPLNWMVSILLIGCCAKLIYCKLNKNYGEFSLVLSLVFIINPFFIQNMLYRFDNVGMFLGLFFAVLSFSLNNTKFNFFPKIVFILFSLNFYQSFSNLFISLIAIELILMAFRDVELRVILNFIFYSAFVYFIANVIYFIELKLISIPSRGALLPIAPSSIVILFENYFNALKPFKIFCSNFKGFFYFLIPLSLFSFLISKKTWKLSLALVVSAVLLFISTIGAMALLENQFTGSRVLHYFSPIMMFFTIVLMLGHNKIKWFMVVPIFACFIFSYRVGNIHKIQREFERPIAYNLSIDLLKNKNIKIYYSINHIPYSKYIKNIKSYTPFQGFMNRDTWKTIGILNEYVPKDMVAWRWNPEAVKTLARYNNEKLSMTLFIDRSPFYQIYTKGNEGWIVWAKDN